MKPQDSVLSSTPFEILFEDNHLIAVNKPPGLVTQPTESSITSLEEEVKKYIKEKYAKSGNVYLHAVHRLDKVTSGITLFAKTSKALSRLNESIREKVVEKRYLAVCEGIFSKKEETLTHFLLHDDYEAKIVNSSHPQGKKSELYYKVIKEQTHLSLVEVHLTTGRYHQIRTQLSAIHHPVYGDKKYGSVQTAFQKEIIALHHFQMSFPHPTTQERITIKSDPPAFWPMTINSQ
ncbi:MAG: Pseudouridine synthase [Chlamydiia bacterium]|nr:Pseudouridine synthase [Chlamydiia bacterium]